MSRHLMLVPSLACPASCSYCFGPHAGGASMSRATLETVADWQSSLGESEPLDLTFHGGEPLVAGLEFYRTALPLLRDGLAPRQVRFSVQSNLWLLTDAYCELFKQYEVSLGTSLDGPQAINDAQRGEGYYRRTMAGVGVGAPLRAAPGGDLHFHRTIRSAIQRNFRFFSREGDGFQRARGAATAGQARRWLGALA